ncbi:unnamed protein product [Allacma fusca]|uniref:Sodium-dependent nutrient amino acid transporter 1 n=1 Tax=Allacma fusca TaxID=39272 RepID=A0A8J2IXV2_9HEXA|nr:unnamed protein product [Allacma fusca]
MVNTKKEDTEKEGHVNIAFENDPGIVTGKAEPTTPEEDEDEGPEREAWAYANGGGAFLIPYLIVLTVIGRPIYFLEIALGQFSSTSQVRVWNSVPFFKGIGFTLRMKCLSRNIKLMMGLVTLSGD